MTDRVPSLARGVADALAALPGVFAVAYGGSGATGMADANSDLDLYAFVSDAPPIATRTALARRFATRYAVDMRQFGVGDEWVTASGQGVDIMYWWDDWIAAQLDRVLVHHEPSVGYSTAFWATIRRLVPLFDRDGYLSSLTARADVPYPEPLRRAIIAFNYPLLRDTLYSFRHQVEIAVTRGDMVSVQHRAAAFLASYFDVLFAANRVPHPGEKRSVAAARILCGRVPDDFERDVEALLNAATPPGVGATIACDHLVEGLDTVLREP
jgi:hypothetical protein